MSILTGERAILPFATQNLSHPQKMKHAMVGQEESYVPSWLVVFFFVFFVIIGRKNERLQVLEFFQSTYNAYSKWLDEQFFRFCMKNQFDNIYR